MDTYNQDIMIYEPTENEPTETTKNETSYTSETSQISLTYCRNPDYKHCFNKCPCQGRWINCNYYIDKEEQRRRLKRKHTHNETIKEIQEWYTDNFRINWSAPSIYMSG